jgi:hypothetical protein
MSISMGRGLGYVGGRSGDMANMVNQNKLPHSFGYVGGRSGGMANMVAQNKLPHSFGSTHGCPHCDGNAPRSACVCGHLGEVSNIGPNMTLISGGMLALAAFGLMVYFRK